MTSPSDPIQSAIKKLDNLSASIIEAWSKTDQKEKYAAFHRVCNCALELDRVHSLTIRAALSTLTPPCAASGTEQLQAVVDAFGKASPTDCVFEVVNANPVVRAYFENKPVPAQAYKDGGNQSDTDFKYTLCTAVKPCGIKGCQSCGVRIK